MIFFQEAHDVSVNVCWYIGVIVKITVKVIIHKYCKKKVLCCMWMVSDEVIMSHFWILTVHIILISENNYLNTGI